MEEIDFTEAESNVNNLVSEDRQSQGTMAQEKVGLKRGGEGGCGLELCGTR